MIGAPSPAAGAGRPEPLIGAHFSVAGGLCNAVAAAVEHDCRVVQLFVKNANRWEGPPISAESASRFRRAAQEADLCFTAAHASYLINPASPDDGLWRQSIEALLDEARRSDQLGLDALVLHPGAHRGSGEAVGVARIAAALDRVAERLTAGGVSLALEGTAGQGTQLGHRFEHLRDILAAAACSDRLTVCLDTCHLHAAGYDLSTADECAAALALFDRVVGAGRLQLFHLNDSKRELGSRVDRHAHIGKGFIGSAAFEWILNEPALSAVPKILETPKDDDGGGDRRNLRLLRSLVRSAPSRRPT